MPSHRSSLNMLCGPKLFSTGRLNPGDCSTRPLRPLHPTLTETPAIRVCNPGAPSQSIEPIMDVNAKAATSDETAPPLPELMTVLAFAMYAISSE